MEPIVRRALNRIDAVHTVLDVPDVPVIYTYDLERFGGYIPTQNDAERYFEVSYYGPYPQLTLTHEIGHLLDHALGDFDVYLSSEPVSALSKVMRQLEGSKAIQNMRQAFASSPNLLQTHRFQLLYWLNPQEQWARAYAQFIAAHSEDAELSESIVQARDARGLGVFRNVQWEDDDFAPIDAAINATFIEMGWMK